MRRYTVAAILALVIFGGLMIFGYMDLTARSEMSPDERPKWTENLEW